MEERTVTLQGDVVMPLLGLGTWQLRGRSAYNAVSWALEAGYRHFDTATAYRNESEIGSALVDNTVPREEVFITTKLPPRQAGNEERTLERSLEALRTDYVDLWLIHWPPNGTGVDVWEAFAQAHRSGFARAIGVSNYSPRQIDELIDATGVVPSVNQIKWSPFIFDSERLDHSRARGVVLEGYSPFKAANLNHPLLGELASRYRKSPAQIIIRWHVDHGIVAIPKSARKERIESNFDVFDFSLQEEEIAQLDALAGGRRSR
jgi:2,5-diketo-D-gluconate reductase A